MRLPCLLLSILLEASNQSNYGWRVRLATHNTLGPMSDSDTVHATQIRKPADAIPSATPLRERKCWSFRP